MLYLKHMNKGDPPQLKWTVHWEGEITSGEHKAFAGLLAGIYPKHHKLFIDTHSWYGARPELRVVGYIGDHPVAHLGILRRFVHVSNTNTDILVGDVGLVGVDPALQGKGVGKLLLEQTAQTLNNLELPFGFITCKRELVPFYRAGGWLYVEGQTTRMIDREQQPFTSNSSVVVLPVLATMSEWPSKYTLDRNGQEV